MNRREWLESTAFVGAAAALSAALPGVRNAWADSGRIVVDGLDTSVINAEYIDLLRKGGVHCIQRSAVEFTDFGFMHTLLDELADSMVLTTTVAEIQTAKADGKIALTTGAQHANVLEKYLDKSMEGTIFPMVPILRSFYELGLRIQGICYNVPNIFGGGCRDHAIPLSEVGHKLVEAIHKLNIILDVGGHTGEQTSLDAIAMSKGVPIICTHTNAAGLNANARAISDRLAEAIAGTGGVIGVTAVSDFHVRNPSNYKEHGARSPQASLEVHLDQYDYFKKLVGVDHIGLGPDFVWGWGDKWTHDNTQSLAFPPDSLGDGGPFEVVKDFEEISKLPNVENGLRDRGWKQDELDKLLGGNWMRVYKQVWG